MAHKHSESVQTVTPSKPGASRPKSMFARLTPNRNDDKSQGSETSPPSIPNKSPKRRIKRFSMMLRPHHQHDEEPTSPLRSAAQRSSHLQTRRYKYEDKEGDIPLSPSRSSVYSLATQSRSSLIIAPLDITKSSATLGSPAASPRLHTPSTMASQRPHTPKLPQAPYFGLPPNTPVPPVPTSPEQQSSVWIDKDKPKRTSFLSRSASLRASPRHVPAKHKKTLSGGFNRHTLSSPLISPPQLVETTNHSPAIAIASPKSTISSPKEIPQSPKKLQPAPPVEEPKVKPSSERLGFGSILRFFRRESKPDITPKSPQPDIAPATPIPTTPVQPQEGLGLRSPMRSASVKRRAPKSPSNRRKYQSAKALTISPPKPVPTRPQRGPQLEGLRPTSQLSLQSSNDSHVTSGTWNSHDLVTPTGARTASPRVHIEQEWDSNTMYQRGNSLEGKRAELAQSEWI